MVFYAEYVRRWYHNTFDNNGLRWIAIKNGFAKDFKGLSKPNSGSKWDDARHSVGLSDFAKPRSDNLGGQDINVEKASCNERSHRRLRLNNLAILRQTGDLECAMVLSSTSACRGPE